jgi:hypothetical protein
MVCRMLPPIRESIMKLQRIHSNAHVLSLQNGVRVLFSYADPVAAYVPGTGWMKTVEEISKSSQWVVSNWLHEQDAENVVLVPQDTLDTLLAVKEQVR